MPAPRTVRLYLPDAMRARAEAGEHRFLASLLAVLREAGLAVTFHDKSLEAQFAAGLRDGLALFHRARPEHVEGLVFRKNYHTPFWQIADKPERWKWPVARANFDAAEVDPLKAATFIRQLRHRHFKGLNCADDGFVYVPLQGRLLQRRSFQAASPLEMLEAVLAHDSNRPVVATLHPGEHYTRLELEALEHRVTHSDRLTLSAAPMAKLLPRCSYVVSQNSSVALNGFILEKPAALFGAIDFHHIAAKVDELGAREAIRLAPRMTPDFPAFLYWFFQMSSINARRPNAHGRITQRLRSYGWPV